MYSGIKQLNRFTDMIQIRPSQLSDLDRLMEIFDHARKFMASVGNGNQWINGYPQRELIAKEITDGHCYACEDEHGKIVGTFCFVPSPDPFYAIIEDGAWLNDDPYYVIHRIASDGSYKGIGDICLNWCTKQYPSLRADTHNAKSPCAKRFYPLWDGLCLKWDTQDCIPKNITIIFVFFLLRERLKMIFFIYVCALK